LVEDSDELTRRLEETTFSLDADAQSVSFQTGSVGSNQTIVYKPGDIVGDSYRLLKPLGQGGMGVVYLAEHIVMQQRVALKLLAPGRLSQVSWQRFEIEGKALALLHHQNIVKIYNMGIDRAGCPFYAMDYLPGPSLADLIAGCRESGDTLSTLDILKIYLQVCAGLSSAHKKGIVHRDIKPSNIILADNGGDPAAKIVDFGIASVSSSDKERQALTSAGEVFGSPLYMSPEQCMGSRVDARSDIYSFGCSLFHSLTGKPPFLGETALQTVLMHQDAPPPTLGSVSRKSDFSPNLEQLVGRLLEKNIERRYQTIDQVAHDLERVIAGKNIGASAATAEARTSAHSSAGPNTGVSSPSDRPLASHSSPPSNRRTLLLVSATGLILIAGLLKVAGDQWRRPSSGSGARAAPRLAESSTPSGGLQKTAPLVEPANVLADEDRLNRAALIEASGHRPEYYKGIDGRALVRYKFPGVFKVGDIQMPGLRPVDRIDAKDVVDLPAGKFFALYFCSPVESYPQYLDCFAGNPMIYCVGFNDCTKNLNQLVERLTAYPNLFSLNLVESNLKKLDFKILTRFKKLSTLIINACELDIDGLLASGILKNLQDFGLTHVSGCGKLFGQLAASKNLRVLSIEASGIKYEDLVTLAANRHLTKLSLRADSIGDREIAVLAKMHQLNELIIAGGKITGRCVSSLSALTDLKHLEISSDPPLSSTYRQMLKQALPACRTKFNPFHSKTLE
jgi:eukaryotic-like serine/threonine-protein kinase